MTSVFRRFRIVLPVFGLAIVVLLSTLPASAASEPPPKAESAEPVNPYMKAARGKSAAGTTEKARVFSNDDLMKMFGAPVEEEPLVEGDAPAVADAAPGAPVPAEGAVDPLTKLFDDQRKAAEHTAKIAAAETKIAAARQKIGDLEKRALGVKNPLMPRPSTPEQGADEWHQADGAERLQLTEAELQKARAALAQAEAELEQLRRATP